MTKETRLRDAAEDFVRTLEECGQSRAEAVSELAAVAVSLAREGNAHRASVLMEVSDSMCRGAEIDQSQVSAVEQTVGEQKSE
jgi:hypothetical protein